jgi:hypothetical protein
MSRINAATLSASVLTLLTLLFMSRFPAVPLWALFIAWACYFHLGGGEQPRDTTFKVIVHMGLGAVAAWLSALLLFVNPVPGAWGELLWGPLVIACAIGILMRTSLIAWLSATPAIIYGYAAIWAFLGVPGRFDPTVLRSTGMENALVAVLVAIVLGVCLGYGNAVLARWLTREREAETRLAR